jgi:L-lactate dehydrogenase complex protein LldG
MSSRDDILGRIRRTQPAPVPLPDMPSFTTGAGSLVERFKAGVQRMGGKLAEPPADGDLSAWVRRQFPEAKVLCSATPEVVGTRPLDAARSPAELHDVDVGVVRALYGVAETGSVWLTDRQFTIDALGFLAQHLVVLLDPACLVDNFHTAYGDRAQFDARYGVFMTGPSATADIEGVLIHGAQGIRSMTVVLVPGP